MQPQQLSAALAELDASHSRRTRLMLESPQGPLIHVDGRDYLAFASNDYLGLANHPALIEATREGLARWGLGGGASHLVAGHFGAHQQAENELAAFVGTPAALLFGSGYAANLAVITSLMGRDDAVFADRLNHASLNDACLLSRAAFKRFRHNDLDHLESLLKSTPAKSRLIAVDAVYSMDGDEAPLAELLTLAERYDAWLYLDDAHGFGVFGDGRGSMAEQGIAGERVIYMATLGKAAGVAGAFVAGSAELIDWLVNKARTYIFTTAQPPALAEAVRTSLGLIAGEPWRRERLAQHIEMLRHTLSGVKYPLHASRSPIQPLMIGGNEQVMTLSARLREAGLWVPAIRPPTVPEGSARLRISLSAAHEAGQVQRLAEAIVAMS
ncbi:8-amino-7-oxononanoate synthase [Pseudogulbenkiania subflava]|uniref:8-amino-7-oxononanoate synthase n=1 Tax=Pseudogulbenkiania subflava DSM 22618 TaxID=1123014 RepID=A0A1Y6BAN3_9NEIS|nr:8-amino-7-oxononanoate synthase [Pseudogulbenkiania subflava]SME93657.1 8-amino-7-oxononanoate synthase [Pseudogulbenkiania subflava DSM 22618]